MKNVKIFEARECDYKLVSSLVTQLLLELEPAAENEITLMELDKIAQDLLAYSKICAFIAVIDDEPIGVITLHECAAIYAGGVFGEISELYVQPEYRSFKVGQLLLNAALEAGKGKGWKRLEVGSPPPDESPRTIEFYERQGFKCIGSRLRCLIE